MMKYLLLTVIVVLGCAVLPSTSSAAHASDEEYAVYSAVITTMFDIKAKTRQLVIQDVTVNNETVIDKSLQENRYIERVFPTLKEGVLRDYKARNKEPLQLKDAFDLDAKYILVMIPQKEIARLFNEGGSWWDEFYKRYPDSGGFISLSRPGFNAARNQALVYIEHHCGGLCGTGRYVLLEKSKDRWRVIQEEMVWVS